MVENGNKPAATREPSYHFALGECRFIWLDADGDRTSPFCKSIKSAYAYRSALLRALSGEHVWSPAGRRPFEPQGSGKPPVRLVKMIMTQQEAPLTEDEALDVAAAERLESNGREVSA